MLTFPLVLRAGTVKIKNTGKTDKNINMYIPNKDSVMITLPAGQYIELVTLSSGESFCYMMQADNDIKVTIS